MGGDQIFEVALDNKNNIYVATRGGLSISTDEGESFKTKTTKDGLASNVVYGVFVDQNGTIYCGTRGGLSVSKNKGKSFKTLIEGNYDGP